MLPTMVKIANMIMIPSMNLVPVWTETRPQQQCFFISSLGILEGDETVSEKFRQHSKEWQ